MLVGSCWTILPTSPFSRSSEAMSKKRNHSVAEEDGYQHSGEDDGDELDELESEMVLPPACCSGIKKRKRGETKIKKRKCDSKDPLVVFGYDIMLMILSHLDARSVAQSLLVSRRWLTVASSDTIWSKKCEELWAGKAHLPRLPKGLSKLSAYSLSVKDSKRIRIMKEDLWDHAWEFHFKRAAPEYWRDLDPYWRGTTPPMHRYFHPDGSQTADPDDTVWGGHECCYSVVTSFLGDGRMREHYVRINRWPHMSISRTQNWGWEMSNHLYCYTSVSDAHEKGICFQYR